ncbi:hypothetical protein [Antrihabitans spumae]|uniref:SCP2 domain-containing protein n=1 Tax=Antrihabitans spumae TaxID=3373370 RepID=A0ABW7JJP0_9NOCA
MRYVFLSQQWFDAVEALRAEAPGLLSAASEHRINVVVRDAPDGDVGMHVVGGRFDRGLADDVSTTVSMPFSVAKSLIVEGDPNSALQSFMKGDITIDGSVLDLLAIQQTVGGGSDDQLAFIESVRSLTA